MREGKVKEFVMDNDHYDVEAILSKKQEQKRGKGTGKHIYYTLTELGIFTPRQRKPPSSTLLTSTPSTPSTCQYCNLSVTPITNLTLHEEFCKERR